MYHADKEHILEAMGKAGWITSGHVISQGEGAQERLTLTPSKAGGERLRALLFLIRELDNAGVKLNPDELGFICRMSRTFAPDQDNLTWPSELPSVLDTPRQ